MARWHRPVSDFALRALLAAGCCLPVRAAEGFLLIRNATNHPWTLKSENLPQARSANRPKVAVRVLDLTGMGWLGNQVGPEGVKPGYWTLEGGRTYCCLFHSDASIACAIGLGGSNRNYKILKLEQVDREGEPATAIQVVDASYQRFSGNPMLEFGEGQGDALVTQEGPCHVTIHGENYPAAMDSPAQPGARSVPAGAGSPPGGAPVKD